MANIVIKPYIGNKPTNLLEVLQAWQDNKTFSTPFEPTSCMSRSDWEKYGNRLDGVIFNHNGLTVELERSIL
jgi:hypothetical protein